MSFEIIDNPDFAGREPRLLEPSCHDGTPFLTFECRCGEFGHMHESQIAGAPESVEWAGVRCALCRDAGMIRLDDIRGAFAKMRVDGWIA